MKAYLLVQFSPGADLAQARHALKEPGIKSIDLVMGAYDAVIAVETADVNSLGKLATQVRGCPGIRNSMTLPVIE